MPLFESYITKKLKTHLIFNSTIFDIVVVAHKTFQFVSIKVTSYTGTFECLSESNCFLKGFERHILSRKLITNENW